MKNNPPEIARVRRSTEDARAFYNFLSGFYDFFAGEWERKYRDKVLKLLGITEGDIVLEIGFGTGHSMKYIAERIGDRGSVYGIDISPQMVK